MAETKGAQVATGQQQQEGEGQGDEEEIVVDVDQMNLRVLQREDPLTEEIVERADHVCTYRWDQGGGGSWKRGDVRGCLFIVRRRSGSTPQIVVLNRDNPQNLRVDVTPDMAFEATSDASGHPFLFFKAAASEVSGLWFLSSAERDRCYARLSQLSRAPAVTQPIPPSLIPSQVSFAQQQPPTSVDSFLLDFIRQTPSSSSGLVMRRATPSPPPTPLRSLVVTPSVSCSSLPVPPQPPPSAPLQSQALAFGGRVYTFTQLQSAVISLASNPTFLELLAQELERQ